MEQNPEALVLYKDGAGWQAEFFDKIVNAYDRGYKLTETCLEPIYICLMVQKLK